MIERFGEEHAAFRRTVRTFAEKELAPHADEWERDEMFPNWVFRRAGELGIHGAHYPEEHGGGGGDYWFSGQGGSTAHRLAAWAGLMCERHGAPCFAGTRDRSTSPAPGAARGDRRARRASGAGSDVAGSAHRAQGGGTTS